VKQILLSDYYQDFFKAEDEEIETAENESRPKTIFITMLIVISLLFMGLMYLRQNVQYSKISYELSALRGTLSDLQNVNNQLQVKSEELGSLSRIEKIAKEQLGLVVPKQLKTIPVTTASKAKKNKSRR